MRGAWTTTRVRDAEDRLLRRVPSARLMRRAAYGVAVEAAVMLRAHTGGTSGRRVVLLVGAGNNGGDALWAGAFLRRRGVDVTALLLAPGRAHPEGLAALRRTGGRVVEVGDHDEVTAVAPRLAAADLAVDGIVGISASGPLRPVAAEVVSRLSCPVLAVDLPSGVDPDTGAVPGPAVRATATVTFGARKPLHLLGPGSEHVGELRVVDIGLGPELGEPDLRALDRHDVGLGWPVPGPADDKYTQGVVGVAAGSSVFPGAAVLATGAAVAATSGMVRYAGPAADAVRSTWPEVVVTGSVEDAGRVQAWAAGPGIGVGETGRRVLEQVLAAGLPTCLDADAITLLARHEELWDLHDPDTTWVLTPHEGEFTRLVGEVGTDRVDAVRRAARRFRCVVLLKGNTTVVADPDGHVLVNRSTSSWVSTAGSGDVLTGMIGALLASGAEPALAAAWAASAHELAGELAARGAPIGASALVPSVSEAIRVLRRSAGLLP
ncbi:bifunctional ADP-dependent NAD(P)H-hydrate dehydratase/NAD(P)H-hydrate epimerase [Actinoalloteichus sp. AHMU CJ021]|uniref:NAD(P)H-hydrate dehydratase n=1 Tax=Actinoalloteichus sp. AHMU CJ021 TaxID=2072503 RepID=UPI000CA01732|nr:bifunctional ADP-dependent NAD(P)H-hydrate dehydratase/NAD(P)H-hydrate epimerase [Actinoalloteichus sp. AHMU CJ021]